MSAQTAAQAVLGQSQSSRSDQSRPRQSTGEPLPPNYKEWISHCIEYVLPDASTLLQSAVEGFASQPEEIPREHELMQVVIGNTAYRLHLVVTMMHLEHTESESEPGSTSQEEPEATLSIYLSLLGSEAIPVSQSEHTSIFLGLKSDTTPSTNASRRACWIMRDRMEWDFNSDADWFQCPLSKVDEIIEDLAACGSNDLTLVVQIQSPEAMAPEPSQKNHQLVPTDLLQAFSNAVDNKNTGDVKFVCLEYGDEANLANQFGENANSSDVTSLTSAAEANFRVYRKRILYAHSDILEARSEYFKALLDFNASITSPTAQGSAIDRRIETIYCNDADFQTLYWLLRYIYCNELELSSEKPLIDVVKGMDMANDPKARRLMGQDDTLPIANEWGWHHSLDGVAGSDALSDISDQGRRDHTGARRSESAMSVDSGNQFTQSLAHSWTGSSHLSPNNVSAGIAPLSARASTAASRARFSAGKSEQINTSSGRTKLKPASRVATVLFPDDTSSSPAGAASQILHSPTHVNHQMTAFKAGTTDASPTAHTEDPHPHPAIPPPPASSFAIYVLAHQYTLSGLQEMAQAALLKELTPTTACGLLLASYKYKDLYDEVKSYVIANWAEIQQNVAFLNAIQEVSNGMWGPDGGLVLHSLFKRLHT